MNDEAFSSLVESVLAGERDPEKRAALNREICADPKRRAFYISQVRVHTLLLEQSADYAFGRPPRDVPSGFGRRWIGLASSLALLLSGVVIAGVYRSSQTKKALPSEAHTSSAFPATVPIQGDGAVPMGTHVGKGETKMNTGTKAVACATALGVAAVVSGMSNDIVLNANPDSIHWRTVLNDAPDLTWSWPDTAVSAVLTIESEGRVSSETFDTSTNSWTWNVGRPVDSDKEKVYELTLTFYSGAGGSGAVVTACHATGIGLVCSGEAKVFTDGSANSKWGHIYGNHAVVQIPEGTTGFTINGTAQDVAVPGWHELYPIYSKEEYLYSLSVADEVFSAMLIGFPSTFVITLH